MSLFGHFFFAIAKVLELLINVYTMVVIASALISWVNPDPYNPLVRIIYGLTEPVFRLVRRILPRALLHLRIDVTPLIVLILLVFIERLALGILYDLGSSLSPS